MTGALICSTISANDAIYTPNLDIGTQISFPDNSIQTKAFTNDNKTDIDNLKSNARAVLNVKDETFIDGDLKVAQNLIFVDNTKQSSAFTELSKSKIQDIIYDSIQQKTTISHNCLINNLICNNINTSHLAGTTNNLQEQISNLSMNTNNYK